MSRASREEVFAALYATLAGVADWKVCSRRLRNAQDMQPEDFPAAFQVQGTQNLKYQGSVPTVNTWHASWLIYTQTSDPDGAPSIELNQRIDAACAALAPPVGCLKQALGGLVEHAGIVGDIEIYEGVLGDRAVAVLPITIVLAGF